MQPWGSHSSAHSSLESVRVVSRFVQIVQIVQNAVCTRNRLQTAHSHTHRRSVYFIALLMLDRYAHHGHWPRSVSGVHPPGLHIEGVRGVRPDPGLLLWREPCSLARDSGSSRSRERPPITQSQRRELVQGDRRTVVPLEYSEG